MSKEPTFEISYQFEIKEKTGRFSMDTKKVVAINVYNDTVPPNRMPAEYLLERIREELKRKLDSDLGLVTLAIPQSADGAA